MTDDQRVALAADLMRVVSQHLAGQLLTGTGEDFKERLAELSEIQARVSAVVMHEGPADTQLLFAIKRMEAITSKIAGEAGAPVWKVK